MKGIMILLGDVYRNAAVLFKNGVSVSEVEGAKAPKWLFGEIEAMPQNAENNRKMGHEAANAIVLDLDTGLVYFEELHPSSMTPFEGDDWFDPILVAKTPIEFIEKCKNSNRL